MLVTAHRSIAFYLHRRITHTHSTAGATSLKVEFSPIRPTGPKTVLSGELVALHNVSDFRLDSRVRPRCLGAYFGLE